MITPITFWFYLAATGFMVVAALQMIRARKVYAESARKMESALAGLDEATKHAAADGWQRCVEWMAYQGQADVKGWVLESAEQANPYATDKP